MRILLVEDDLSLGESIESWLRLDGYVVDRVTRGDHAEAALATHDYQCLLIDRGLPGVTGDALLRRLRERHATTPVIMITARDAVRDRIEGLDLGADDYLVKPFDLEELSARIRAAIRRHDGRSSPALRHGGLVLDEAGKQVTLHGAPLTLTAREFAVLHALIRRPGHIVSRAQLEEALYGWGDEVESNAIEVHIYNLRRKLGAGWIETIRRQGYRLGDSPMNPPADGKIASAADNAAGDTDADAGGEAASGSTGPSVHSRAR
ncbi:response regulator [Imbroritus primus]|uniref:response regulator n=1 Tax=Imbroritus primus TaxID=3058603 RepID=UPI003D160E53